MSNDALREDLIGRIKASIRRAESDGVLRVEHIELLGEAAAMLIKASKPEPQAQAAEPEVVAWLDRKQLAELQNCNGMSVWAESPSMYAPTPSANGVGAPERLVGVYTHPQPQPVTDDVMKDAEQIAIAFHDAYERLAPAFGYETRPDTRQFDPESANGKLMIAVCGELAAMLKEGK